MKTSTKILVGVGSVIVLYLVWEIYLAISQNTTDGTADADTDYSEEDYDSYVANLGNGGNNNSSGSGGSSWLESAAARVLTWGRKAANAGANAVSNMFSGSKKNNTGTSSGSYNSGTSGNNGTYPYYPNNLFNNGNSSNSGNGNSSGSNSHVKRLQRAINEYLGTNKLSVDGIYGNKTNAEINNIYNRFWGMYYSNPYIFNSYITVVEPQYLMEQRTFKFTAAQLDNFINYITTHK